MNKFSVNTPLGLMEGVVLGEKFHLVFTAEIPNDPIHVQALLQAAVNEGLAAKPHPRNNAKSVMLLYEILYTTPTQLWNIAIAYKSLQSR